ncbi:PREDICTED: purple acid phosphatase 17-like [Populus euphratica]|uniref:Purple acid phosphatase 17-like n=1 Tax=Populus euphratica TaxID=75702 RepID=A0AAJ6Y9V4_POPEU|nr:PREDICTED: purple acid phosphatase 17-like [Populus euphratica]
MAGLILNNKSMALCLVLVICGFGLCLVSTHAELQRFGQPAKTDGTLSFLVLGDWGRKGAFNQSEVAVQMGRIGEKLDIDFVVSTGDNFYDNGLTGKQDKAFVESFSQIYTANSLQKQWYSVLGNHDYRGNAEAQLSQQLRKIDSRWLCLRSFIVNADVNLGFIHYIQANNVDFYMNGHDHCLEHISDTESPIQFLTSGAGSKAWRGDIKEQNKDGLKFFYDGQGFMSVQLTQNEAEIAFYDVSGTVLHRWITTKLLHSST